MTGIYIFLGGCFLITVGTILAIRADKVNPHEETLGQFFSAFLSRGPRVGRLKWISLTGVLVYFAYYAWGILNKEKITYLVVEITAIYAVVGVTSCLFKNYDKETEPGKPNRINTIGILHITLLVIGAASLIPLYRSYFIKLDDQLSQTVDVIAHCVTFAVSFFGLMGDTYHSEERKLTKQGTALVMLMIIFSCISVVTSLESSAREQELDGMISQIIKKADKLDRSLDSANENLSQVGDQTEAIRNALPVIQSQFKEAVTAELSPVLKAVNYNLDQDPNTRKGFITQKLEAFSLGLFSKDSLFKASVAAISAGKGRIEANEVFLNNKANQLSQIERRLTFLIDSIKDFETKHIVEANLAINKALADSKKVLDATQKKLNAVNHYLWMSDNLEKVLKKFKNDESLTRDSLLTELELLTNRFYVPPSRSD